MPDLAPKGDIGSGFSCSTRSCSEGTTTTEETEENLNRRKQRFLAENEYCRRIDLSAGSNMILLLPDHQDWTRSVLKNLLSVASKQEVLPTGISVRRYHQKIG
jgi:hypothetical protein